MQYRKLNHEELKELQNHLFQFLCEFDDFCQKYNIDYQLNGGNVLGAVRHQDFIPWDDDLDIMLTAREFNKFVAASSFFPSHWTFKNADFQENFIHKLFSNKYIVSTKTDTDISYSYIWIDIFVLEPSDNIWHVIANLHHCYKYRRNFSRWNIKRYLPHILRFPLQRTVQFFSSNYTPSPKNYYRYNPQTNFIISLKKQILFPSSRNLTIRNRVFPGPHDTKRYLIQEYGLNFMTPPSPKDQFAHCYTYTNKKLNSKQRI